MAPAGEHDLEALGAVWAESTAEDISGLVGAAVSFSGPIVDEGELASVVGRAEKLVYTSCVTQDDAGVTLGVVAPMRAAQVLAALQMEKAADDFKALQAGPFENDVAAAYTQVMDLCVGILGRVLEEEASLPALRLGETVVRESGESVGMLSAERYRRARFSIRSEGFPEERLDVLFPADTAREWFGAWDDGDAEGGEDGEAESPAPALKSIAVLDPCPESRDEVAEFSRQLGLEIVTMAPDEFGDDMVEELGEAGAIVVEWDLGACSGLDVLERLRADPRTCGVPVVVASAAPTHAMVEAALRWGARTFLCKPYDANEISLRLLRGEEPAG